MLFFNNTEKAMLVALYQDHHQLPYWGGDINPFDVFRPDTHKFLPFKGNAKTEEKAGVERIIGCEIVSLPDEKYLFSFLLGLHNVDTRYLMAHVSALCGCLIEKCGYWHYPKRVWVQITTMPHEFTRDGVPVVYGINGDRNPKLKLLFGADNGTYSPYEFLTEELGKRAAVDPSIWTRFFIEQLGLDESLRKAQEDRQAAEELLEESKKAVAKLQFFEINKLNPVHRTLFRL